MTFTLVGTDYYPSAAYALVDATGVASEVNIAAAGAGPTDGFTEYRAFLNDPAHDNIRPRWGDYGAAVTDGNDIWFASEYIGQTCSLAQYYPAPPSPAGFGSCDGTRASLGNWDTRISKITP
jgi:hypothetical protein